MSETSEYTVTPLLKCGGVVTRETTDDEMRARGFSEADIVEVVAFRDWLALPLPRATTFDQFRAARRSAATEVKP